MTARQSFNFTSKTTPKHGVDQRREMEPSGKNMSLRWY